MARSTFPSQNVQSTSASDTEKLRRWNSARNCGAKRISKSKCTKHLSFGHLEVATSKKLHATGAKHDSKSKCTKHTILGPLLEVDMSQECTPLGREAHVQVKMYKAHQVRITFGRWDAPCQKWTKREGFVTTTNTLHCATLHYITLHYSTIHCNYSDNYDYNYNCNCNYSTTTLRYTLHTTLISYSTLQHSIFHYTTLHFTTLNYATLNYTQLHSTTLNYTTLH